MLAKLRPLFLSLLLFSCEMPKWNNRIIIGVDPTFYSLQLNGMSPNVFGFILDLFYELGKAESAYIQYVPVSPSNLLVDLSLGNYAAALSDVFPNLITTTQYSFSDKLLVTGPALVVPKQQAGVSLKDMAGDVVAIEQTDPQITLMSEYPQIETLFYSKISDTLQNVFRGHIQGALIPILVARRYIKDTYQDNLAISGDAVIDNGLRLVTLIDQNQEALKLFNRGLSRLQNSGKYDKLLTKWNL